MKYTKDEIISMYKNLSFNDFENQMSDIVCGNCPFTNECTDYDFFHSDLSCGEIIRELLNNKIVKDEEKTNEENTKENKTDEKKKIEILLLNPNKKDRILTLTPEQFQLFEWLYDYQYLNEDTTYSSVTDIEKFNLT